MAGSYGGVAFMVLAVLFVMIVIGLLGWPSSVYLFHQSRGIPLDRAQQLAIGVCFLAAALLCAATWWFSMRSGVRALQEMDRTPG